MKNGIRLLAVLIGLQCISLQSAIVIENITVIDAKNEVRNGQTVFIENGLIQSIGSTLDSSIGESDSNLERIDGKGKYLIPGLWDAHVHLTFVPEIDHKTHFDLYLKHGVTSI